MSTSRAGFASKRRRADSEATEWIRRTLGAMSLSFRLCTAPMKSQVNRSRCDSCFESRSCARFSPTSSTPACASAGRSLAATYFVAARISTSGPTWSRTRSRLRRMASASIQHHQPRLAAGQPPVATMREEEVGMAARAKVEVMHLGDSRCGQLAVDHRAQVEHAAVGHVLESGEGLEHLGAYLVAAAADPGPYCRA